MKGVNYNPETGGVEVSSHDLHDTLKGAMDKGFTKYVPAPMLLFTGEVGVMPQGEILGVWCHHGEDVEWLWFNERVVGYIVKHP